MKFNISKYIDHTLLKPEASVASIKTLCQEALQFGFAAVCINPVYVTTASSLLENSDVNVCTVVGFPLGVNVTEIKAAEASLALQNGANEIDMVIHIGALKDGYYQVVQNDIHAVVTVCKKYRALCKVIIETALLSDSEKIRACELAADAGADFVKTSTGFSSGGATVHDVELMSAVAIKRKIRVKAAGGIRSYDDAMKMINAGASRIGTSSGQKIVMEAPR